jgi:hypothetical protein
MEKDKTIEDGRTKDGRFLPGHKLQKRRKPISVDELELALTEEASKQNLTLVKHAIRRAYESDTILKVILDKFVPNISVAISDIKPIQIIIEKYYQAEKGKTDDITTIIPEKS